METITKHIGEGFGKGQLYAALAYDSSDAFSGMAVKSMYFNKTLAAATERAITIASTTALTSGTIRSFEMTQTHTGIGAIAEGLTAIVKTNVALGSWANAIYGKLDFQTIGKVTGLGGVICAELTMAGGAVSQGTYATFQSEINLPTSYSSSVPISVMRINTWGAQKTDFDDHGYLFDIQGVASGSGSFFYDHTTGVVDGWLKCRIGTATYYILLADNTS